MGKQFNQWDNMNSCPHEGTIATLEERSENQKAQILSMTEAMGQLTAALNKNTQVQQTLQVNIVRMEAQHKIAVAITGILATIFGGALTAVIQHFWK